MLGFTSEFYLEIPLNVFAIFPFTLGALVPSTTRTSRRAVPAGALRARGRREAPSEGAPRGPGPCDRQSSRTAPAAPPSLRPRRGRGRKPQPGQPVRGDRRRPLADPAPAAPPTPRRRPCRPHTDTAPGGARGAGSGAAERSAVRAGNRLARRRPGCGAQALGQPVTVVTVVTQRRDATVLFSQCRRPCARRHCTGCSQASSLIVMKLCAARGAGAVRLDGRGINDLHSGT